MTVTALHKSIADMLLPTRIKNIISCNIILHGKHGTAIVLLISGCLHELIKLWSHISKCHTYNNVLIIPKRLIIKHIFREPHNDLPSIFGISSRADNRFIFWRQAEDCEVVDLELRHRSYWDRTMWGIKKWRTRPSK